MDTDLTLPRSQMLALAGANGTGKSKLMACMLAPWTHALPPARDSSSLARVEVDLSLTLEEREVIEEYDSQTGWSQGRPPENVTIIVTNQVLAGTAVASNPQHHATQHALAQGEVLKRQPSLNLIYLPAERRLLPPVNTNLDLNQLTDDIALMKVAEGRSAAQNFGRLDEQEFESYAKALCVAGSLPSERGDSGQETSWAAFKTSVDTLIFPKEILPLTRENPSAMRIGLPGGASHAVHELSSGERQALIIVSRVFRAGEGHSLIAIDEPDAYLHPALSSRLIQALRPGLGEFGSMILATHSPSILDSLQPESIVRLTHEAPPTTLESEAERMTLYREAGFRASTLTQSDGLLVTEGDFDVAILPQIMPVLGSMGLRAAGGRSEVIKTVQALAVYDVPILGVVDSDVGDLPIPANLRGLIHAWPAADIEGLLLSDDGFLQSALDGGLIDKAKYPTIDDLRRTLTSLLLTFEDNAIAEFAQRRIREKTSISWPSLRGDDPIGRLTATASSIQPPPTDILEDALASAREAWSEALPDPWKMVRGKWIIGTFVSQATEFKSSDGFINAVLARKPEIASITQLDEKIKNILNPANS